MESFILVHGSGQNAGCWSRVAGFLRARGHAVAAPDLPKSAPGWGLSDYASFIAQSVEEPESVVVAHSFCGVFLPLVPRFRPCGLLVYLAAVVPEIGKSVRDQFAEDPAMFSPAWIKEGPRWFDKSQLESLAREFLFHDCDDETLPWALGTVESMNTSPLVTQPTPLTRWPDVPAVSIVSSDDRTLSPDWGRRISRRLLHREALEVTAGHCPQVSRPEVIAGLLEELAKERSSPPGQGREGDDRRPPG